MVAVYFFLSLTFGLPSNVLRMNIGFFYDIILYILICFFGCTTFYKIYSLMKKLHTFEFRRTEKNMRLTVECIVVDLFISCIYYIAIIVYQTCSEKSFLTNLVRPANEIREKMIACNSGDEFTMNVIRLETLSCTIVTML